MKREIQDERPLVEAFSLKHLYSEREVLRLNHWALRPGERHLLLGPSGSGKTTLISILTGLLQPTSGQVNIAGKTLASLSPKAVDALRAKTFGLVFQDHHLVSSLSLEDNLLLALRFSGQEKDEQWAHQLLALLGLEHLRHCKPSILSRCEAQRAAIARAAICKPPILIADEPTAALDDANTDRVITLFTNLANEWGAALLVASHDSRLSHHFDTRISLTPSTGVAA
ncbi:MAG: ABC transporter ATP-binding protein [Kordiimonas sp.]